MRPIGIRVCMVTFGLFWFSVRGTHMNLTCPHCGKHFDVESQQKRAIKARWAKESNPGKRAAAAKRQAEARWGVKVTLDFGQYGQKLPGYIRHVRGQIGADYRLKGEKEWKPAPDADLIGETFYVYGR